MKTTHKSRMIGSAVVLGSLLIITLLVLHGKEPLNEELARNDQTNQVLSLPAVGEQTDTAWNARESQQLEQSEPAQLAEASNEDPLPIDQSEAQLLPAASYDALMQQGPSVQNAGINPHPKAIKMVKPVLKSAPTIEHPVILQVASFNSSENAQAMRAKLSAAGYMPRIEPVRVHNKTWYRLSAGPFPNQQQARLAQVAIQRKWKLNATAKEVH